MGRRLALVIGVGKYEHYPDLEYAPLSAEEVYQVLTSPKYGDCDPNASVLKLVKAEESLTEPEVNELLLQIIEQLKPGDQFVFYFCGHGEVHAGDFFLILPGTPKNNPLRSYDFAGLSRRLKLGNVNKAILIVDTCHSKAMFDSVKHFMGDWKPNDLPTGFGFLAATSEFELARQDPHLERTIFSYYFVEGIRNGLKDSSEHITVGEIRDYVNEQIVTKHPGVKQIAHAWVEGAQEIWIAWNSAFVEISPLKVASLSPSLFNLLRITLCKFDIFGSNRKLKSFFGDKRLSIWQDSLPEMSSPIRRVEAAIDSLRNQYTGDNKNAIALFLEVLSEQPKPVEDIYDLRLLNGEINLELQGETFLDWYETSSTIPGEVYRNLRWTLLHSGMFGGFDNDEELSLLFSDKRISYWRSQLRNTDSRIHRVEAVIDLLHNKYLAISKQNGLILLLRVIYDRLSPGDGLRSQIAEFAYGLPISNELIGWQRIQTDIPDEVLNYVGDILLKCDPFISSEGISAVFVDYVINPWYKQFPKAVDAFDQMMLVVNFLHDRYRIDTNDNGLVLFLQSMSERLDRGNAYREYLLYLASEIEKTIKTKNEISFELIRQKYKFPELNLDSLEELLKNSLLRCFDGSRDSSLAESVFFDPRLVIWCNFAPTDDNDSPIIDNLIRFLRNQYNSDYMNAMWIFLCVLIDQTPSRDLCFRALADLANAMVLDIFI